MIQSSKIFHIKKTGKVYSVIIVLKVVQSGRGRLPSIDSFERKASEEVRIRILLSKPQQSVDPRSNLFSHLRINQFALAFIVHIQRSRIKRLNLNKTIIDKK